MLPPEEKTTRRRTRRTLVPRDARLQALLERPPFPIQPMPKPHSRTRPLRIFGPYDLELSPEQEEFWGEAEREGLPVTSILYPGDPCGGFCYTREELPIRVRRSVSVARQESFDSHEAEVGSHEGDATIKLDRLGGDASAPGCDDMQAWYSNWKERMSAEAEVGSHEAEVGSHEAEDLLHLAARNNTLWVFADQIVFASLIMPRL